MNGGEYNANEGNHHQDNIQQTHDDLRRLTVDLKHGKCAYEQKASVKNDEPRPEHIIKNVLNNAAHELND